jgi:hypothetical protein
MFNNSVFYNIKTGMPEGRWSSPPSISRNLSFVPIITKSKKVCHSLVFVSLKNLRLDQFRTGRWKIIVAQSSRLPQESEPFGSYARYINQQTFPKNSKYIHVTKYQSKILKLSKFDPFSTNNINYRYTINQSIGVQLLWYVSGRFGVRSRH